MSPAQPVAGVKDFTKPAIVILGYALNPDGTMQAILRRRVLAGLVGTQSFPESPIIVTGGNPQNGRTEAGQMRNMLTLLGFPENRIIVEDKATNTVRSSRCRWPSEPLPRASSL